jgi:hypothetical protein
VKASHRRVALQATEKEALARSSGQQDQETLSTSAAPGYHFRDTGNVIIHSHPMYKSLLHSTQNSAE